MPSVPFVVAFVFLLLSVVDISVSIQRATEKDGSASIFGCQAFTAQSIPIGPRGSAVVIGSTATPSTPLHMNFFSDFLGGIQKSMNTGGSYNLGIDYDALDFPGPEVGAMAVAITRVLSSSSSNNNNNDGDDSSSENETVVPSTSPSLPHLELATFAGGCFWGLELAFQRCNGVEHTLVGYTQGAVTEVRPNYEQVSAGNTGHCEAVLVYFDPDAIDYENLLRTVFFERVDVTTVNGQGRDFGRQYRTGIYFHTQAQEATARKLLAEAVAGTTKPVATEVAAAKAFWPAEAYHQRYLEKGGRFGQPQSAGKGNTDEIRCYG